MSISAEPGNGSGGLPPQSSSPPLAAVAGTWRKTILASLLGSVLGTLAGPVAAVIILALLRVLIGPAEEVQGGGLGPTFPFMGMLYYAGAVGLLLGFAIPLLYHG